MKNTIITIVVIVFEKMESGLSEKQPALPFLVFCQLGSSFRFSNVNEHTLGKIREGGDIRPLLLRRTDVMLFSQKQTFTTKGTIYHKTAGLCPCKHKNYSKKVI